MLDSFYKDESHKEVRQELFNHEAEEIAKSFSDDKVGVTSTQLRRLFDEVKRFERLLDGTEKTWNEQKPYIKMINSKVRYTVARAKRKDDLKTYYENLQKFISDGLKLVDTEQDYHIFTSLFEAVYGFYYERRPDKNN